MPSLFPRTERCLFAVCALITASWAQACSCLPQQEALSGFLHADTRGTIALPADALGVIFMYRPAFPPREYDASGNQLFKQAPRPLGRSHFTIRDLTEGSEVEASVSPVDLNAQRRLPALISFAAKGAIPEELLAYPRDFRTQAQQIGLEDISAAVLAAEGLFRIAPRGGFVEDHDYEIRSNVPVLTGREKKKINVSVGARLGSGGRGAYRLVAMGSPVREMLELPASGMCSEQRLSYVQRLQYLPPPGRQAYGALLMAFTFQRFYPPDIRYKPQAPKEFVETYYYSAICGPAPRLGESEAGRGLDLVHSACVPPGTLPARREVRGLVGMLEIDSQLQMTDVLEVPFAQATGEACPALPSPGRNR